MATDLTSFEKAMRILYPDARMERLGYEDQPFLAWLPKRTDFYGAPHARIPIQYGFPGGSSSVFEDAQANKTGGVYGQWEITRKRGYTLLSIDNEVLEASESKAGAFVVANEQEIDGAFIVNGQRLGAHVQGNGGGAIGRVSSGYTSGNVITLADPNDIVHFEKNQRLQSASTDGTSGAVRTGSPGYVTVTAVDRNDGQVTVDNIAQITGFAASDYLFAKGDFGNAVTGLDAWLPTSDPGSGGIPATLNGIDRSVDPTRLGGIRFDGSSYSLPEALQRACARGARERSMPSTIWVNHDRFMELELELGNKAVREPAKYGSWGYDTLVMHAGGRKVRVMADHNIHTNRAYILDRKCWKFFTLKKAPRFLNGPGGKGGIIEPTRDGVEIRIGWYGDVYCTAPGNNIVVTLPSS